VVSTQWLTNCNLLLFFFGFCFFVAFFFFFLWGGGGRWLHKIGKKTTTNIQTKIMPEPKKLHYVGSTSGNKFHESGTLGSS
jgi:hypothetical protein